MNKYKIGIIICSSITALALIGLAIWFITGSIFGIGGFGMQRIGLFNINRSGVLEGLTGPFELVGTENISPSGINSIDIDWVAGEVTVRQHDGAQIVVTEYAQRELRDNERFRVRTDGDTLEIDFYERGLRLRNVPPKRLQVLVPRELSEGMRELEIDSVSGAITVEGINAERFDVESISGEINANGAFQRVDLNSVSGAINFVSTAESTRIDSESISGTINITGAFDRVDVDTVSGSVTISSTIVPSSVDISSVSGGITIYLPDTDAISVNHSSVSGRLSSDIPHTTGGRDAQIQVSTVSGSTSIRVLD